MHYYQFNIGDFASHTAHLEPLEEIAYRRMLDYCYLHEIGLPQTVEEIARLIRMRSHSDCIAVVLREFFVQHSDGSWRSERVDREVAAFRKSQKTHWAAKLSKEVRCALAAKRRAAKASAIPRWLTPSQHKEMQKIYEQCRQVSRESGVKHEVDHIVPLMAENACGLHVPWNLQIIPAHQNRQKSNRLEEC